jgi:serine/threonine-protein kinase
VRRCPKCGYVFRGDPERCAFDGTELETVPDPLLNKTFQGRYTILSKLGSGGMGSVYRATDSVRQRDVAVKFLAPELAVDPRNRQRFLREAKAANRIDHEHIIHVADYNETTEGHVYLVMEYLDGTPLNVEIAKGPFPIDRALRIALQIAEALGRAHEHGVVHRDIKPDNVFLLHGYDGDYIKLLDFGLAKMKGELRLTATGAVFGTPEYMSPEQARGAPATFSVDLYALGCVLYEMLCGQLPFTGSTPDLILKHMREVPEPPSSRGLAIPAEIDALTLRLLSKEPEARPPTAYALAEELRGMLDRHGGGRREAKRTVEGARSTVIATEFIAEEAWEKRVAAFRSLVLRVHPDGRVPAWLVPSIDNLSSQVERMRVLRRELTDVMERLAKHETEVRDARLRIGRALDELGRDEADVLKRISDLEPRVADARGRLEELEKPLLRSWGAIPPMPAQSPSVTRDLVETLRDAGQLAGVWLEAQRIVATLERDREAREREREDLRFQVAQLVARMEGLTDDRESELAGLRQKSADLDTAISSIADELFRGAQPVYQHFAQYPELSRAALAGTGA